MEVLVVGAGVVGRVYGSQLAAAGHSVSVLQHGAETSGLARSGLLVCDVTHGTPGLSQVSPVTVVDDPRGRVYDLVLICVRADQLPSVSAPLGELVGRPVLLFFGNNPAGHAAIPDGLPGAVHLGFPGVGGSRLDGHVEFVRVAQQPTTLEAGGGPIVEAFAVALVSRGYPVTRTSDMDGWLAYHGVFIASVSAALYRCHGSARELSTNRALLVLMCRSIEEGFAALRAQGIPGLPGNLRTLHQPWLRPVAVRYWAHAMASPMGEQCFAAHARHAEPEMRALAADARRRVSATTRTEHLHRLLDE